MEITSFFVHWGIGSLVGASPRTMSVPVDHVLEQVLLLSEAHSQEVRTPLDAVALLFHALATHHYGLSSENVPAGWRSSPDMHGWSYELRAEPLHTIHIAVVRLGSHAVVLASHANVVQEHCSTSECLLESLVHAATPSELICTRARDVYVSKERIESTLHAWTRDILHADANHNTSADVLSRGYLTKKDPNGTATDTDKATEHDTSSLSHTPSFPPVSRMPYDPRRLGDADRDPLAASPAACPFGTGSFQPPRLFPPHAPMHGDGMIMGPNHPLFCTPQRPPGAPNQPETGFLPPGSVPPHARFDPVSPFDSHVRARNGEPDFDDFAPPHSMFS